MASLATLPNSRIDEYLLAKNDDAHVALRSCPCFLRAVKGSADLNVAVSKPRERRLLCSSSTAIFPRSGITETALRAAARQTG